MKKVILPVAFKKDILKEIKKFNPDIILGLGQKKRGKLLEIERTTRNVYKKDGERKIVTKGLRRYFLNLTLERIKGVLRRDYHSGKYVCNYTRYLIMDFIAKNKLDTQFAFLHIPKDYSPKKVAKVIQKIISETKN